MVLVLNMNAFLRIPSVYTIFGDVYCVVVGWENWVKKMETRKSPKNYVCTNCGNPAKELFKNFTPSVIKTIKCDKCNNIVDKYIEFEPVITLVDVVLLSESAFRHVLYNSNFKLQIKLSLVLLLLESFALWRQKRQDADIQLIMRDFVDEKGFYICCLINVIDNILLITVLLCFSALAAQLNLRWKLIFSLYKAITIANFSKFFLLPIMIWRENTTDFGAAVHHLLVMSHYMLSFVSVYSVVSGLSKFQSAAIVLPVFFIKDYIKRCFSMYIEANL